MPKRALQAPDHLAPDTAQWWIKVHTDFELEEHHTRLLTHAAEAFDRCRQAREAIEAHGLLVATGDGSWKASPAVSIERDSRLAFARILRELDLDIDAPTERRLPGIRSNRRGA